MSKTDSYKGNVPVDGTFDHLQKSMDHLNSHQPPDSTPPKLFPLVNGPGTSGFEPDDLGKLDNPTPKPFK